MAETTCRHGVSMDRSCIRCGRFVQVIDDTYLAKQANFNRSIEDLEAMLVPFLEEIEKAKAELAEIEDNEPPLPPDFPWTRKN